MGLVQYLVVVLTLSAQSLFTFPQVEKTCYNKCQMCPAGKYQRSCTECLPCPAGSFTSDWNCEDSCHRCLRDCRSDYDLKVVQNCTSTSNTRCVCKTGFTCTQKVQLTDNCASCVKIQQTTTTAPRRTAALHSGNDKKTPSTISFGRRGTSAKPCPLSKCGHSVPPTPSADVKDSQLAAILCPVVVVGCVALVILFCVRQPGDETCFKRAFAKLRNEGRRASSSSSYKSKESTHQFPRESFSAKQQPPSLAAANLGPVHVHNPGTVIFSLLSQFTGQVGATTVGGKTAERVVSEEDDERDSSPVCHPTTSPSVHLSEEERSGDIDSIFFPSQEQGKDCHVSKEEEL